MKQASTLAGEGTTYRSPYRQTRRILGPFPDHLVSKARIPGLVTIVVTVILHLTSCAGAQEDANPPRLY
jgi:hypothetical protein